jgi:hypothetical protein
MDKERCLVDAIVLLEVQTDKGCRDREGCEVGVRKKRRDRVGT